MFGDDNSYIYVVTWWIVEQKSLVDQKSGEFHAEKPKKKNVSWKFGEWWFIIEFEQLTNEI